MSYSLDLRQRVVGFVNQGGSKAEASRRFNVSLWCVNDWCQRDDLTPNTSSGRPRKLNWDALEKDIKENPDKLLRERAESFGVWINSVWYACQQLQVTRKKNT